MLAADPAGDPKGAPVDHVASITPDPLTAHDDLPDVYANGCHLDVKTVTVRPCTYGDPTSDTVVAVVGDSHAAQWLPALEEIATQRHWKLLELHKIVLPVDPGVTRREQGTAATPNA